MATIANLVIDQGSDYSSQIYLSNADGQPLDLTGYFIAAQARRTYKSNTAYNFICQILIENEGLISISLSNGTTSTMKSGRYVYDVELTSPAGVKTRALEGTVEITPEVTR